MKPLIADVDQSAGQLALVKLAPEIPQSAVQVKINFSESTNKVFVVVYLYLVIHLTDILSIGPAGVPQIWNQATD